MKQVWFVSRQSYWGIEPEDGQYTVEVAYGGLDYANPGMLPAHYPGEGREYNDPREAVKVAIDICEAWKLDAPYMAEFIGVAIGCTGGDTLPFEQEEFDSAIAYANRRYEALEKCDRCGDLIDEDNHYTLEWFEGKYCSDFCATEAQHYYEIDYIICQVEDESSDPDDDVYVSESGNVFVNPTQDEIDRFNLDDPESPLDLIWRLKSSWTYNNFR